MIFPFLYTVKIFNGTVVDCDVQLKIECNLHSNYIILYHCNIVYIGLPQSSSTRSFTQTNGTSSLHAEVTTKVFPVKTPVLLDNPLNVEGIMKKIKEFNAQVNLDIVKGTVHSRRNVKGSFNFRMSDLQLYHLTVIPFFTC